MEIWFIRLFHLQPSNVVGTVTNQGKDERGILVPFPERSRTLFSYTKRPDRLQGTTRLPTNKYRTLLLRDKHSRSVKLTTYLQSVLCLRKIGTKPLQPLNAFMVCTGANLPSPFNVSFIFSSFLFQCDDTASHFYSCSLLVLPSALYCRHAIWTRSCPFLFNFTGSSLEQIRSALHKKRGTPLLLCHIFFGLISIPRISTEIYPDVCAFTISSFLFSLSL